MSDAATIPYRNADSLGSQALRMSDTSSRRRSAPDGAEEETERPKKQRRRLRKDIAQFYDIEAVEAEASEDEDEEEGYGDLIDDSGVGVGSAAERKKQLAKIEEELAADRRRDAVQGELRGSARVFSRSALDAMEERYKAIEEQAERAREAAARGEEMPSLPPSPGRFDEEDEVVSTIGADPHTRIFPEEKDPKLWCVKTFKPECELVVALLRKAGEYFSQGKPVPIYSAFWSPLLRGYIYVEAHRESDIHQFSQGIYGLARWQVSLVPQNQMQAVFTSALADAGRQKFVQVGDWVRMKRGLYTGDLGQILQEASEEKTFWVKLKPRISQTNESLDGRGPLTKADKALRKPPPQRWFNKTDLEVGGHIVNADYQPIGGQNVSVWELNGEFYRDGFLWKKFREGWFVSGEHARPQEFELQDWRNAPPVSPNTTPDDPRGREQDRRLMPPPAFIPKKLTESQTPLEPGDVVIHIAGEHRYRRGVIQEAISGASTVLVSYSDIGYLTMESSQLAKYFEVGDYVKVLAGEHAGDTGFVLQILADEKSKKVEWGRNTTAKVVSSCVSSEFVVKIDNLRLTTQKPQPQDAEGEFRVGNLVYYNTGAESRGIIVRLEAKTRVLVLGLDGNKHSADISQIHPVALPPVRKYERTVHCEDRKGNIIRPGCTVLAPRGKTPGAPLKARVLFIHNSNCFLKALEGLTGERAYLVSPGNCCEFISSSSKEGKVEDFKKEEMEEAPTPVLSGIVMASQMKWSRWNVSQQRFVKNNTVQLQKGQHVKFIGGKYKHLRGTIHQQEGNKVKISLQSATKLVDADISDIQVDMYTDRRNQYFGSMRSVQDAVPEPAADEEEWDPDYGTRSMEVEAAEPTLPQAPQVVTERASEPISVASGGSSKQGRGRTRASILPQLPMEQAPEPPKPEEKTPVTPMPSKVEAHEPDIEPNLWPNLPAEPPSAREAWLQEGVGVQFTHEARPRYGWITKVYADMVHVLPADLVHEEAEIMPMRGSSTNPWTVNAESIGEPAIVFSGPRKGEKGTIAAVTADSVYLRFKTSSFSLARGNHLVQVEKDTVARYCEHPGQERPGIDAPP